VKSRPVFSHFALFEENVGKSLADFNLLPFFWLVCGKGAVNYFILKCVGTFTYLILDLKNFLLFLELV